MTKDMQHSVQKQFSKNPEKYRDEKLFAMGEELHKMVESVSLTGEEMVLDIGTGAGHTALAFSPYVKQCIGLDLTREMVQVSTDYAKERKVQNVSFRQGDVEDLPFPDESFDIVTCRYAAHHFANIEKAVQEISRVLKRGGHFLLVDHYAPSEPALDEFINSLDRMRDPSHVRESSLAEWEEMFKKNGLAYHVNLEWNLPIHFASWVERAGATAAVERQLVSFLQNASASCRETFQIVFDESGNPKSFCLKAVLLDGVKR